MEKKVSSESVVKEIRRRPRIKYSSEEKNHIVLKGIRGEESIAKLCSREGMPNNSYYRWNKEFSGSRQEAFEGRYSPRGQLS